VSISSTFYVQKFTCNFCTGGAQKRKKDSQVVNLFTLLGSACAKAVRKYVGEIDPWFLFQLNLLWSCFFTNANRSSKDLEGSIEFIRDVKVLKRFF
jgi:hypothetical protein